MNKQRNTLWPVIAIIALLFLELFLDYFNIPAKLGINVNNFNWNVQAIVINAIVTISMFLAAYYLVDRWNTHKHQNQEATAKMLLRKTYNLCHRYIEKLDDEYSSELSFLIKRGGEISTSYFFSDYEKRPFDFDNAIMKYFSDGTLSGQQMVNYTCIKGMYATYIKVYSIFRESKEKMKIVNDYRDLLLSELEETLSELEREG